MTTEPKDERGGDEAKRSVAANLLPCPFCGSDDLDRRFWASEWSSGPGCNNCGATAEDDDGWNQRADADPLPVSREAVARIILAHVSGSDPDELIHHPWQKSWEAPTMPRWEQFAEAADAILALTGETSRDTD